jgi:hypothetical protein
MRATVQDGYGSTDALDLGETIHGVLAIPSTIAEVWMVGYLLVKGVRSPLNANELKRQEIAMKAATSVDVHIAAATGGIR